MARSPIWRSFLAFFSFFSFFFFSTSPSGFFSFLPFSFFAFGSFLGARSFVASYPTPRHGAVTCIQPG